MTVIKKRTHLVAHIDGPRVYGSTMISGHWQTISSSYHGIPLYVPLCAYAKEKGIDLRGPIAALKISIKLNDPGDQRYGWYGTTFLPLEV